MILQKLQKKNLIHPPKWLSDNTQFLTIMGSDAYGVSSGASDVDIYGFAIPPKYNVFPHLTGEIFGFGTQIQRFEQWSEHHIIDHPKEYDFAVFSIVKYFQLCMECNPNMIDTLFVPRRCILHSTAVGEYVRENRKLFLHKGAWHKFKGYAYSQLAKYRPEGREKLKPIFDFQETHGIQNDASTMTNLHAELRRRYDAETVETGLEHLTGDELHAYNNLLTGLSKRNIELLTTGMDTKSMYHVVRLLSEVEQIMIEHDLDLERNREQLKSIRRGEWSLEQLQKHFEEKERHLEGVYANSSLRHSADETELKEILLNALEMHYGNLSEAVVRNPSLDHLLDDLRTIVDRYSN